MVFIAVNVLHGDGATESFVSIVTLSDVRRYVEQLIFPRFINVFVESKMLVLVTGNSNNILFLGRKSSKTVDF